MNVPTQRRDSSSRRIKSWRGENGVTKLQLISGYFALSGLIVSGAGIFFVIDPDTLRAKVLQGGQGAGLFAFLLVGVGILLLRTSVLLSHRKRSGAYCAFLVVALQVSQWTMLGSVSIVEIIVTTGIVAGILLSWRDLKT